MKAIPDSGSFRAVMLTNQCIAQKGPDGQEIRDPNCEQVVDFCLKPDESQSFVLVNNTFEMISYGQG